MVIFHLFIPSDGLNSFSILEIYKIASSNPFVQCFIYIGKIRIFKWTFQCFFIFWKDLYESFIFSKWSKYPPLPLKTEFPFKALKAPLKAPSVKWFLIVLSNALSLLFCTSVNVLSALPPLRCAGQYYRKSRAAARRIRYCDSAAVGLYDLSSNA